MHEIDKHDIYIYIYIYIIVVKTFKVKGPGK